MGLLLPALLDQHLLLGSAHGAGHGNHGGSGLSERSKDRVLDLLTSSEMASGTSSPELVRTGEDLNFECLLVSSGLTWTTEPAVIDSALPGITLVLQLLSAAGEPSGSRGSHDGSVAAFLSS